MAIRYVTLLVAVLGMVGAGCSTSKIAHDADYVNLSYRAERALSAPPEEMVNPVVSHLAGPIRLRNIFKSRLHKTRKFKPLANVWNRLHTKFPSLRASTIPC